ncbi:MAG TPA: GWxTD domain-containing protein [Candidatus Syntrophosphaera thermopropionivorans]|nr:GWxTD domain-containing protein [Candidatus Syntrophosphaera thermopropionivorans]HPW25168.1 GWxTD domain-containing protein [Candidatus Syntrophosphaera thermopropionivorans]
MKKAAKLALLFILISSSLLAQEVIYEHYADGVDFWVLIPYNSLVFKHNTNSAVYNLSIEIKNKKTKDKFNYEETISVPRREWLQDTAIPIHFQAELAPGKYETLLRFKNLNLGNKTDLKRTFILDNKYTSIGQPFIFVFKEGIQFQPSDLTRLPSEVDSCILQQKFSVLPDSIQVFSSLHSQIFDYPRGKYQCDLTLWVNQDNMDFLKIVFFEDNVFYEMEPFYYSPWFYFNAIYSYEDQIQQIRYIANQNEWNKIRKASPEEYPEIIEQFWQNHDPSPGTPRNEFRESFYQRVRIADERFTVHKKLKGWKSDRGRIYIKYGEPDEVYSEVHPLDLKPYIVWVYYKPNRVFVFMDRGGYGQYELRNKDEEF